MRGGIDSQVNHLFKDSGILRIGASKHEAKEQARSSGAKTWHEVGKKMWIYSYGTADTYKDIWHEFARFAKAGMGLKDLEKTTADHVKNFLSHKIEGGILRSTYRKIASAMEKYEVALNMYSQKNSRGREYGFGFAIKEASKIARNKLKRIDTPRAYDNPKILIDSLANDTHCLVASIQHEGGARISEAALIKKQQLRGIKDGKGTINLNFTKGGKERQINLNSETYQRLEKHIEKNGELSVDKNLYRHDLRRATERSGQDYKGSHGFRWSYAQERMDYLQKNAHTFEQALTIVSNEMGHNRADITNHYLRK